MASTNEKTEQLRGMGRRLSTPGQAVTAVLEENGIPQSRLAGHLGVSRKTVCDLVRGKRTVTPDMDQRAYEGLQPLKRDSAQTAP
jgi:plasmid maintenance system antidote protein VapI